MSDAVDSLCRASMLFGKPGADASVAFSVPNLQNLALGEHRFMVLLSMFPEVISKSSVLYSICMIGAFGIPSKIAERVILRIAVIVTALKTIRAWAAKRLQHEPMNSPAVDLLLNTDHHSAADRLAFTKPQFSGDDPARLIEKAFVLSAARNNPSKRPDSASIAGLVVRS